MAKAKKTKKVGQRRGSAKGSAGAFNPKVRHAAAVRLGFHSHSRCFATDHLQDALLSLAELVPQNTLGLLLHTIDRMNQCWDEWEAARPREASYDDWNAGPRTSAYYNQQKQLRSFADQAIVSESPYRPWYDLGALLGDLSNDPAALTDQAASRRLLVAIRSLPAEQRNSVAVLKRTVQLHAKKVGRDVLLRLPLQNAKELNPEFSTINPTNSTILRFIDNIHDGLARSGLGLDEPKSPDSPSQANMRLTPAQQQIVDAIRQAGHRLTTDQILDALNKANGNCASEGTTKNYLAALVRGDVLTNRQDVTPKGYGLAEWK